MVSFFSSNNGYTVLIFSGGSGSLVLCSVFIRHEINGWRSLPSKNTQSCLHVGIKSLYVTFDTQNTSFQLSRKINSVDEKWRRYCNLLYNDIVNYFVFQIEISFFVKHPNIYRNKIVWEIVKKLRFGIFYT